jgi:hypothetical protein
MTAQNDPVDGPRSSGHTGQSPSRDGVFDVLANSRRRHAVRCLLEHGTPMTLADLADEVAEQEHGAAITELSGEAVKRIYLSLYHTHVPKLVENGVAEYSQERDMVALSEDVGRLERVLNALSGEPIPRAERADPTGR